MDDSETQAPEDIYGGTGAMHDSQPEYHAPQALDPNQVRLISKYIC
jgi:hypothetical protein